MKKTPKELGYFFPAEWEAHEATWLSFPHNEDTWPRPKMEKIYPVYFEFIKLLSQEEEVRINVLDLQMENWLKAKLKEKGADFNKIHFYQHPTNDAWCRDYGPIFLINPDKVEKKIIVDWEFNAWGGKYPFYENDNRIPSLVASKLNIPIYKTHTILEGGAVDFNGQGTILSTQSCLFNKNRNIHLNSRQIEWCLYDYFGIEQVIWLEQGINGDDTDGHVDNLARFVNPTTVLCVQEANQEDGNYHILRNNFKKLEETRLFDGRSLEVIALPMPEPFFIDGQRMPASYANFYIANKLVIMPTYACPQDQVALKTLAQVFPDRRVIGLDSRDIIWGLGSFHCLSQQEPALA